MTPSSPKIRAPSGCDAAGIAALADGLGPALGSTGAVERPSSTAFGFGVASGITSIVVIVFSSRRESLGWGMSRPF